MIGVCLLVLALAGAALIVKPGPVAGWLEAGPDATPRPSITPDPVPTPVLAAAGSDGVTPGTAAVTAALDPLVGADVLGSRVRVSVVDAATGDVLYERDPDTLTTPASTTKVLTAATVLAARGPAYRLTTRAVAGDEPGEVVLVGGGDVTMSVGGKGLFPGAARLDRLSAQVKESLGGVEPTKVTLDDSLFEGDQTAKGWTSGLISPEGQVARVQAIMTDGGRQKPIHNDYGGDPRFGDPALSAASAFAKQLGVSAKVERGTAPAGGAELGVVQSPPLVQVVDWMLSQSDNVVAEALARQVALAAGQPASFDGAADAMVAKLTELGLPGDEATLYDASGLSRKNGISPALLTDTLTLAASGTQPALSSVFGGLPVAGWSGTLRTRFVTPTPNQVGQGIVRAKTGSLSGVNAIAGELVTEDGRVLIFAVLADDTGDSVAARQALDRIAARLVACGC